MHAYSAINIKDLPRTSKYLITKNIKRTRNSNDLIKYSKTGESFFSNNWIATDPKNLSFTAAELKNKAAFENMKPSSMDKDDDIEEDTTTDTGDLELDDL